MYFTSVTKSPKNFIWILFPIPFITSNIELWWSKQNTIIMYYNMMLSVRCVKSLWIPSQCEYVCAKLRTSLPTHYLHAYGDATFLQILRVVVGCTLQTVYGDDTCTSVHTPPCKGKFMSDPFIELLWQLYSTISHNLHCIYFPKIIVTKESKCVCVWDREREREATSYKGILGNYH